MTTELSPEGKALWTQAKRLVGQQRRHRGTRPGVDVNGKKCELPGLYKATPESEARAREIIRLRRRATRL